MQDSAMLVRTGECKKTVWTGAKMCLKGADAAQIFDLVMKHIFFAASSLHGLLEVECR
jgi:hypothetical protein